MARQKGEPCEEAKQVRQDDPLVAEVGDETGEAGPGFETGESDLVEDNCRQPKKRDPQSVAMEKRDPEQGETEQDKMDRNGHKAVDAWALV